MSLIATRRDAMPTHAPPCIGGTADHQKGTYQMRLSYRVDVLATLVYECGTYGSDVVLAFADWCYWQQRILRARPSLRDNLRRTNTLAVLYRAYALPCAAGRAGADGQGRDR